MLAENSPTRHPDEGLAMARICSMGLADEQRIWSRRADARAPAPLKDAEEPSTKGDALAPRRKIAPIVLPARRTGERRSITTSEQFSTRRSTSTLRTP